jgi:hypothetical protein
MRERRGLTQFCPNEQRLAAFLTGFLWAACDQKVPDTGNAEISEPDYRSFAVEACGELQQAVESCGSTVFESQYAELLMPDCSQPPAVVESLCWKDVVRDTNCGRSVGLTAFDDLIGECIDRATNDEVRP